MGLDPTNFRLEEFPSDPAEDFAWQISRAEPGKPVGFICLSLRPFGVRTHFYQGRTIPCMRHGCAPCKLSHLSRYTGYLAGLQAKSHRALLVEYSSGAAKELQKFLDIHKSLRGSQLILSRVGRKPNGPLRFEHKGIYPGGAILPPAPDILDLMSRVWRLDRGVGVDEQEFDEAALSEHERVVSHNGNGKGVAIPAEVSKALGDLPGQSRIPFDS